jgi:hypothetical protein
LRGTYGGRCHNTCVYYRSQDYDELEYDQIHDYLIDADVKSLYPTAMSNGEYPYGESRIYVYSENNQPEDPMNLPIGMYEVDVIPPDDLLVPVLPMKKDIPNHSYQFQYDQPTAATKYIGNTVWDLIPRTKQVYTSVDIRMGAESGYKFQFYTSIQWAASSPNIFRNYISLVYNTKKTEDEKKEKQDPTANPTRRNVSKLRMNSLYGKQLQKRIANETKCFDNENTQSYGTFLQTHDDIQLFEIEESLFLQGNQKDFRKTVTKPMFLGAFILAYSRKHMYDLMNLADPCRRTGKNRERILQSAHNSLFYTDTDSLFLHSDVIQHRLKHVFGPELGQLDNELGDGKIIEAYFLSPKLYAIEYITKNGERKHKMRAKGIPSSLLEYDHYRKMYRGETVAYNFDFMKRVQHKTIGIGDKEVHPFTVKMKAGSRVLNQHEYTGRWKSPDFPNLTFPTGFGLPESQLEVSTPELIDFLTEQMNEDQ